VRSDELVNIFMICSDRYYNAKSAKFTDVGFKSSIIRPSLISTKPRFLQTKQNPIISVPFVLGFSDGDNSYVSIQSSQSRTVNPEQVTVEVWARLGKQDIGTVTSTGELNFPIFEKGTLGVSIALVNGEQFHLSSPFPEGYSALEWHHYAFTFDGVVACLFIDGEYLQSKSRSGDAALVLAPKGPDELKIGNSDQTKFCGEIAGVRVSCCARTMGWIQVHSADLSGKCTFKSLIWRKSDCCQSKEEEEEKVVSKSGSEWRCLILDPLSQYFYFVFVKFFWPCATNTKKKTKKKKTGDPRIEVKVHTIPMTI
jgi:hypothetical protein